MKIVLFLLAFMISLGTVFGQSNKVIAAFQFAKPENNELDKAKQAIDEASVHPKTSSDAKTWYYRGLIYYRIYKSHDERYRTLDPDPLNQAYRSFVKAKELDELDNWHAELLFQLTRCSAEFFNKGTAEFEKNNFPKSVESFETVIEIGKLSYINQLDTGAFFNAALAAEEAGKNESVKETTNKYFSKAIEYYNISIDLNYGGPQVFLYVAQIYLQKGDTAAAWKTYEAGIKKYPEQPEVFSIATEKVIGLKGTYLDKPYEITSDKTFDEVWSNVIDLFATKGLSIKLIDKSSGLIVSEKTSFISNYTFEDANGNLQNPEAWVVLSSITYIGGHFSPERISGEWNVRIKAGQKGKTTINVNLTNIEATRHIPAANNTAEQNKVFQAMSTGKFEQIVANFLR